MKQFKQKVWIGIGAFVLAGSQVDLPGKGAPSVGYASALAASPKEGGEGGEGGEAGKRAGPQTKVDWLTGLALVEGHLFVAMELLRAGAKDAAHVHLKHPKDEIYTSLRPGFRKYHAAGFAKELEQLAKAVDGEKGAADSAYTQVEKKIDLARQKAPANAKTQLQVAARLLTDAAGEYRESLKNGRIADAKEYQDAYGFTKIARRLIEHAKPANDSERAALGVARGVLKETDGLWPSLPGDGIAGGDPAVLQAAASRIELAASGLR
jgi:hypothetical protein